MHTRTWVKAITAGAAMCIGGPALVYYVSPTEEELFKKYNPDLQKRALETRQARQEEFEEFVTQLKEYSKSDKPIWAVQKEVERRNAEARTKKLREEQASVAAEIEKRRDEIRSSTK
ncbi:CBP4-domain-containing protein [Delitschia confertaspora ATCC 74209]|uniref:Cytochrome b mRNA-processing protein 4 n=1 Tax=Delitschia confertaspora ATCC 74209 TaxID=1513339 RepID=A0A9P4JQD5_9PLEO|nr:CBP4-domain-containing protein [Delitschia confertaspora ATCC 74209]